jgi:hypothetical protein
MMVGFALLSALFVFIFLIYAMFYCRKTLLRIIGWAAFIVFIILVANRPRREMPGVEATKIVNDLHKVREAIGMYVVSGDRRPPRAYSYDNAAFNEKFRGYFDRPLQAQAYSFVIVLDDSTTGNVFTGLIAPRSSDALMNDKNVRLKLAGRARDSGLLKNASGDFYDGGDVIMMLLGNFPALKEGAVSGDLTLER